MLESGLPALPPGKTKSAVRAARSFRKIATAGVDSGTRCSLPALVRSAGIVQTAPSRSISSHRAPIVSDVRVAVRIQNSSASAVMPDCPAAPP
jgi:hypothetical protein